MAFDVHKESGTSLAIVRITQMSCTLFVGNNDATEKAPTDVFLESQNMYSFGIRFFR